MMVKKPTILVDTREKIPFDFEGDNAFADVVYEKLDVGDYTLEGLEHIIAIERKYSADELYNNFGSKAGNKRIQAEFDRMSDVKYKFIVIEETLEDIMNPDNYYVNQKRINKASPRMPCAVVVNALADLTFYKNVHVIYGGEKAQSVTRGLLLRVYDLHRLKKI